MHPMIKFFYLFQNPNVNGNQVALPVPGGYNPMKTPEQLKAGKKGGAIGVGAGQPGTDMYKLKTTVQTLEASLSKKNKEIAELKKSRSDDDNSFQNLGKHSGFFELHLVLCTKIFRSF